MRHSLIASLFLASLFLSGCSKEEENYDNAITFLNSNPIITEAIFSEEFNELQNHSAERLGHVREPDGTCGQCPHVKTPDAKESARRYGLPRGARGVGGR